MIALIVVLALPAVASARGRAVTPAGNSSIQQYVESIPTVKGNRPTTTVYGGGGSSGGGTSAPLSAPTQRALIHEGSAGRQVAALTKATGSHRAKRRRGVAAAPIIVPSSAPGSAPVSAVVTGGGIDPLLLIILVLVAIAPALLKLLKLRRRRPGN